MSKRLFHVSEESNIHIFEPRIPYRKDMDQSKGIVWVVSEDMIYNYLFPRECPRVTYYGDENSNSDDVLRFIGESGAKTVAAVEKTWIPKILNTTLYIYEFNPENFELQDKTAGYYISYKREKPIAVTKVDNILEELLKSNIELRIMPSIWELRDEVLKSTLPFSFIRMKNASPRK